MIVKPSDFQGENAIGQIEQKDVQANVNLFINKYEPIFLKKLLGVTLAMQLEAEIESDNPGQKWKDLEAEVKTQCVDYIYYWYQRDAVTASTGTGEALEQSENSTRTSVYGKMARAWNEMALLNIEFLSWIDTDTYPNYKCNLKSGIYNVINPHGTW